MKYTIIVKETKKEIKKIDLQKVIEEAGKINPLYGIEIINLECGYGIENDYYKVICLEES